MQCVLADKAIDNPMFGRKFASHLNGFLCLLMVGCHIIPYCFSSSYTLPSTKHPASTNTGVEHFEYLSFRT